MDIASPSQEQIQRFASRIYEIVKQVPPGRVTTYGTVAQILAEEGCDARMVGAAMAAVQDPDVPWQRVINAKGTISTRGERAMQAQRKRLEAEGIVFDERGRIDLERFGWRGPDPEWAAQHGYQTLKSKDEPEQPALL